MSIFLLQGCYYGRGAIQISYNFNYGLFNRWLDSQGIKENGKPLNLLENPNLIMTKTDPPLSIMASLWFYMTPQSGVPSMHDIVIGNWVSPDNNYAGRVLKIIMKPFICTNLSNSSARGGSSIM